MSEETIIRDETVSLVRRNSDHFDLFQRWYVNQGEWLRYDAPWEEIPNQDVEVAQARYLKRLEKEESGNYRQLIIKVDNSYIGWVSLYDDAPPYSLMVGIAICEDAKLNQGIGTRALKLFLSYVFRQYQCHRIGLVTWSFNQRMIAVAKKVGFIQEGHEREVRYWNEEWIDRFTFGILKREWEERLRP